MFRVFGGLGFRDSRSSGLGFKGLGLGGLESGGFLRLRTLNTKTGTPARLMRNLLTRYEPVTRKP